MLDEAVVVWVLLQVPLYIAAQCGGSIMASFMLRWILHPAASEGATIPAGSDVQSLLLEIVITFILMFVVAAVATDTRAVRMSPNTASGFSNLHDTSLTSQCKCVNFSFVLRKRVMI